MTDDAIGLVACPRCLTPMVDAGEAADGSDARLECPTCRYVTIAV